VPIVVVFTQFDLLLTRMEDTLTDEELEMTDEAIESLTSRRADDNFQKSCLDQLDKVGTNLPHARASSSFALDTAR
jgi:hypothetical protein